MRNALTLVAYAVYSAAWLLLIFLVNSAAPPPEFSKAVVVWAMAIIGTTIPVVNYLNSPSEDRTSLTLSACLLATAGWVTFILLTYFAVPTVGPRWLFFAVWFTALTGTAIPFARYLNLRFGKSLPPESVLLRQSIWVGLFGATCAWLQLGRALNWATGLLLAAALVAIEIFLLLRARSRWRPDDS